ncbi:MAG: hypothetical protein ACJ8AG_07315 [Ktedonobacteraceae bacterium]
MQAAKSRGQPALDRLTVAGFSGDYDLLLAQGWQRNPPPSPFSGSQAQAASCPHTAQSAASGQVAGAGFRDQLRRAL